MKNNIGLNKRKLTWIVSKTVLLFIFCGLSSNPMCAYAGSDDVWYWKKNYVGALTGYGGSSKTPVVPSRVTNSDGASWNVTWLFETFKGNSNITAVTLTAGIRTLTWAFQDCVNLSHVTIQGDTINLDICSFKGCASLHDIDFLPDSVTSIGQSAFAGCTGLKTLNWPTALTNLDIGAFQGCTGLTSVRTPPTLQRMKSLSEFSIFWGGQFSHCSNMRQAWIDGDGLLLSHGMLGYCSNLEEVVIGDGAIGVYVLSNVWEGIAQPFMGDTKLKKLTVGTGITNIPPGFCSNLTGLCSAVFHGFGDTIGQSAFQGCSSLTTIELGSTWTPERVEALTFADCEQLSWNIDFSKCTSIGWGAFSNCLSWSFGNVDIPLVTNLGRGAFANCNGLTSLTLGKGMTNIWQQALTGCMGLEKISVDKANPVYASDKGVLFSKDMGRILLYPMGKKGGYVIPNTVTALGNDACIAGSTKSFCDCINLTSVTIPDSIKFIPSDTFFGCSNLTSVTIAGDVEYIDRAFYGCMNLTNIWFKGDVPGATPRSFTDMAPGAKGYYTAAYSTEWRAAITNGMWCGLIMEESPAERIYRVRLHGNGATTEQGEEWVDLEEVVGKGIEFPEGVFTQGKWLKGDLSGWLKGWWPATGVYDGAKEKGTDLWNGILLQEKDIDAWKAKGWMEDIDGVPTVHFYAVWKSEVLVGVHGAYGKDLEPKELESVVKYFVTYNHYYTDYDPNDDGWRTGVGSYAVLPGEQRVVVDMDSGFGGFYTVTLLKKEGLDFQEVAPVSEGGWIYDISSTEGPQEVYLQIRVEPKEEMGNLWFKFTPEMTDAQRAASWGEKFPDFDEEKVQIKVRPAGKTGNGMSVGKSVVLPEGKYQVEIKYTEMAGEEKSYWDTTPREREIEVQEGKTTEINVVFRPFGSKAVDYSWIVFDGNGGTVKGDRLMWFTPSEYPNLFGFHFPSAGRAGGWKFEGWWYPPQGKLVKTWRELDRLMRSDLPGNLTLKAQWERVENAATGTGTVVPHEWLESVASATLTALGGDFEAAAAATAANGMGVWECYVAGLDPEDKDASFKAELVQEEEKWKAKPVGGEKEGRVYRVEGKRGMADSEEWTDVTDVEDVEAEGWHFFRLGVELAE